MTETSTPPEAPPPQKRRRRLGRRLLVGALVVLLVLAIALVALYLNRRVAAREALVGWLDRRGIEADVEVERLELNGFVGKITIGDPKDPQVRVDRVEVDYALGMPWSKTGLSLTPSRVRLVRPLAKASWKDGKLSLGSLDPLIEEFTGRPPKPDSRAPLVIIERGQALLDTEYGPVRLMADARIDNSRLISLSAQLPKASLKSGATEARDLMAALEVTTRNNVIHLDLKAKAADLRQAGLNSQDTQIAITGQLPYPDTRTRQIHGPLQLSGQMQSGQLTSGATVLQQVHMELDLATELQGWIDSFTLTGNSHLRGSAQTLTAGDTRTQGLTFNSQDASLALSRTEGKDLHWQVTGPAQARLTSLISGDSHLGTTQIDSRRLALGGHGGAFEASGPVQLRSQQIRSGDLDLRQAQGQMKLDLVHDRVTRMRLNGSLSVPEGRFTGLGPALPEDVAEMAALKQGLSRFNLSIPAVALSFSNAGLELNLPEAASLRPANGGLLKLEASKTPLLALQAKRPARGALKLVSEAGGGLPEAEIDITQWQQVSGGIEADLQGTAALDFGTAQGLSLKAQGRLFTGGGLTRFSPSQCLPISLKQLELGENDLTAVSGNLCPSQGPMLVISQGRTQLRSRLTEVMATVASVAAELRHGEAELSLDSRPSNLGLTAQIERLALHDLSDPARFLPLDASGKVVMEGERLSGTLNLKRKEHDLGQLVLNHDLPQGTGSLDIRTPDLLFSEYGLQPSDLSPMAADFVQSPVAGSARFEGQFAWGPNSATSQGVLSVPGLDFTSPAGKIEGLSGQINFTSLTPLTTAPGQRVRIDSLATVVPLTDLDVEFTLADKWLMLAGGSIQAAGGQISIEPFDVPLNAETPWNGVIVVKQVQLNELIKSANLQDKAKLDSIVSGRLPFAFIPGEGWKIINGQLHSIRPGRLSIAPETFDELGAADAGAEGLPPNTMQDLAYQAMQDLAISALSADVNSLENGRLGIRFNISGRHDPPQREQLRLTLMEFIRGDYLKKKLNLPSDTPIDLTLDTTWNANQIASDLMDYIRRGETP